MKKQSTRTITRLAIACLLAMAVTIPATAADAERGPTFVEGWTSWLGDLWGTMTAYVGLDTDEIGGTFVPIGKASSGSAGPDELGPMGDPVGGEVAGGQDDPGGGDEMGPLIEPIGGEEVGGQDEMFPMIDPDG